MKATIHLICKQAREIFLLALLVPFCAIHAGDFSADFQEIQGSPFSGGPDPASSAYSPLLGDKLFLAVPNFNNHTITVYLADPITGALTEIPGSPFTTGNKPAWQAYSPLISGNLFSAVVNLNDDTVSVYEVDQTTGAFTPVAGSPFATGASPYTVAFSPVVLGNLFAAVTNSGDNTVSVYAVNASTGAFTAVPGSPFPTGATVLMSPPISGPPKGSGPQPYTVAFSPVVMGNLFAAITNFSDQSVSTYQVDPLTGAFTLVPGSPFPAGTGPYGIAYSPVINGNLFVSTVNLTDNTASVYEVDQVTGALSEIAGSPFLTGIGPNEIAYSPVFSGDLFAAVVNFTSNNLSLYLVDPTSGLFTEIPGSPFATGGGPDGITFTPVLSENLFAAIANFNTNNTTVYKLNNILAPPSHFLGLVQKNTFLNGTECVLKATWDASPSANIVAYRIYQNGAMVSEISANAPLVYKTCLKACRSSGYAITAVNANGAESDPVALQIIR
ncbi:MAG: lactonase family protein [Chlamydiales bacterium]|nr:lactonase family protein [Chlamydiales bacterium]